MEAIFSSLEMLLSCATYCEQLLKDIPTQYGPAEESTVVYEKVHLLMCLYVFMCMLVCVCGCLCVYVDVCVCVDV